MSLDTVRQHFRVIPFEGEPFEVWTAVPDYRVQAFTWKRHPEWPTREEDPVGNIAFMAWAAARRSGEIAMDVKFEAFVEATADVQELEPEKVVPTGPAPGAG